jgi:hypothetical protein
LLEVSPEAAILRIQSLISQLENDRALLGDCVVWVRAEGGAHAALNDGYLISSVGRELQMLSSHAVHHFALIGFILGLLGVTLPPNFGVAPSTLHHRETLAGEEAA